MIPAPDELTLICPRHNRAGEFICENSRLNLNLCATQFNYYLIRSWAGEFICENSQVNLNLCATQFNYYLIRNWAGEFICENSQLNLNLCATQFNYYLIRNQGVGSQLIEMSMEWLSTTKPPFFSTLLTMKHTMNLQTKYFEYIKNGTKQIELRLNDSKRKAIKLEDTIVFTDTQNPDNTIERQVVALLNYQNFSDLMEDFDISILASPDTNKDELLSDLQKFYTPQMQKENGVLGIKLSSI